MALVFFVSGVQSVTEKRVQHKATNSCTSQKMARCETNLFLALAVSSLAFLKESVTFSSF